MQKHYVFRRRRYLRLDVKARPTQAALGVIFISEAEGLSRGNGSGLGFMKAMYFAWCPRFLADPINERPQAYNILVDTGIERGERRVLFDEGFSY